MNVKPSQIDGAGTGAYVAVAATSAPFTWAQVSADLANGGNVSLSFNGTASFQDVLPGGGYMLAPPAGFQFDFKDLKVLGNGYNFHIIYV